MVCTGAAVNCGAGYATCVDDDEMAEGGCGDRTNNKASRQARMLGRVSLRMFGPLLGNDESLPKCVGTRKCHLLAGMMR